MTDAQTVERWVTGYRAAWESNDADDIRALFTDDAVYKARPNDPKAHDGIEAIVAGWLADADEPGTWTFEWMPLALDADLAIVQCVIGYSEGEKKTLYDNLWVIRFAPDGRATEFTEWWMSRHAA